LVDQIENNEVGGACSTYGEGRNVYRVLVGKLKGKRPLGRCRHRWEDNVKIDLQELGWSDMDWIDLAQDRDTCECGNEPLGSIKCREFLD
jgi:hypothetical protein